MLFSARFVVGVTAIVFLLAIAALGKWVAGLA